MIDRKRWGKGILALCLTLAGTFPSSASKSQVQDAKDQAASLENEKKRVERMLGELESLKQDTVAYVRELDASLAVINEELVVLEQEIVQKEEDIEEVQEKLEKARETEEQQYEMMKLRIRYMYETGKTSYLDLFFQSDTISQLLNRAEYISQISEYDRNKMDEYIRIKEEIADREAQLQAEHEELLALQQGTRQKHQSVEQLLSAKSVQLKEYEGQIASAQDQISEYEKDLQEQEEKIRQMEAEIRRKEEEEKKAADAAGKQYNTPDIGDIKFIWPCPASKRITSNFGSRNSPTEGASSNHQGMDIGAPTGTDIVAAAAGEVTISTYSYSAGNYIMINHGGGVYTAYMHCSELLVSSGEKVSQGQVIAKVGSTGVSTGPHLHFGVRINGNYVDPAGYVSP